MSMECKLVVLMLGPGFSPETCRHSIFELGSLCTKCCAHCNSSFPTLSPRWSGLIVTSEILYSPTCGLYSNKCTLIFILSRFHFPNLLKFFQEESFCLWFISDSDFHLMDIVPITAPSCKATILRLVGLLGKWSNSFSKKRVRVSSLRLFCRSQWWNHRFKCSY